MPRILLVDSRASSAQALCAELARDGHDVHLLAHLDVAALAAAFAEDPQLVMLSLDVAAGSGLHACLALKETADLRSIPLLLLAEDAGDELAAYAQELQCADAVVRTPLGGDELRRRVSALLPARAPADSVVEAEIVEVQSASHVAVAARASAMPPPSPSRAPPPLPPRRAASKAMRPSRPAPARSDRPTAPGIDERPHPSTEELAQVRAQLQRAETWAHVLSEAAAFATELVGGGRADAVALGRPEDLEPWKAHLRARVDATAGDRDLAVKRAADLKGRFAKIEAQHETLEKALAAAEERAETALERAREEERARLAAEQELARVADAQETDAERLVEALSEAERARRDAQVGQEKAAAAAADAFAEKSRRIAVEEANADLKTRALALEQARAQEQARREEAEGSLVEIRQQAREGEDARQRSESALRAELARAREELQAANEAAARQADRGASDAAERALEAVQEELRATRETLARVEAERAAAIEASARASRDADGRVAARERELQDGFKQERQRADARWMEEMHLRILGAIEILEKDRGETLAADREAAAAVLRQKEAEWAVAKRDLEGEVRELALETATLSDQLEDATDKLRKLEASLADANGAASAAAVADAVAAEKARFEAASAEWAAWKRTMRDELAAVQERLARLLQSP